VTIPLAHAHATPHRVRVQLSLGSETICRLDLDAESMTIGRSAFNQLTLGHPDVDPVHARLFKGAGRVWFQPIGRKTYKNDELIQSVVEVTGGEVFTLGPYRVALLACVHRAEVEEYDDLDDDRTVDDDTTMEDCLDGPRVELARALERADEHVLPPIGADEGVDDEETALTDVPTTILRRTGRPVPAPPPRTAPTGPVLRAASPASKVDEPAPSLAGGAPPPPRVGPLRRMLAHLWH
jgi:hypothetical protein